ncbi:hypothetical protein CDIK_1885, partial [Cucumispora dikerogammari]
MIWVQSLSSIPRIEIPIEGSEDLGHPFYVLTILSSDSPDSIAIIKRLAEEKLISACNDACLIEKLFNELSDNYWRLIKLIAVLVFLVLSLFMVYCFLNINFFNIKFKVFKFIIASVINNNSKLYSPYNKDKR